MNGPVTPAGTSSAGAGGQASLSAGVEVTEPAPFATFAYSAQLPADLQRIRLAARLSDGAAPGRLLFALDGSVVAFSDGPPYWASWGLEPGVHHLTARSVGEDGALVEIAPVTFTVLARDPATVGRTTGAMP
jgi:hypothetical protein